MRPSQPPPPLPDWNAPPRGPRRDQAGDQWRRNHQDWDSYAPWRYDPYWWRGDTGFRQFNGLRSSYFFIPDLGYIYAPRPYRNHHWRAGEYLPSWYWPYKVRNYARYGLPRPPRGCIWVWVDRDVALIDSSDGYILDIVHNVW